MTRPEAIKKLLALYRTEYHLALFDVDHSLLPERIAEARRQEVDNEFAKDILAAAVSQDATDE